MPYRISQCRGVGRPGEGDKAATIDMVGQLGTANGTSGKLPLVIDLDGTLLKSDLQHECALQLARREPGAVFQILYWLARGRVAFRQFIAARGAPEIEGVPAREDFIAWTESEHAAGRPIILAAADPRVAHNVAARFRFIDEIIATDGEGDAGRTRADVLCERFPCGYIYAGCSVADLAVWRRASGIVLVNASGSVERQARAIGEPMAVFPRDALTFTTLRRALRAHQWAKNALVFIPLLLGGKFHDQSAWAHALLGFLALSLLASSTYLVNDLWDLDDDRRHWSKRARPLAAGQLSIRAALIMAAGGLAASFALIAWVGAAAAAMLGLYLAAAMAYSFRLKREPILDALTLAGLFTLRLGLGVAVTGVRFSPWLFVFSMFVFTSLSLAKRCTELSRMVEHGEVQGFGRGYKPSDEPLVLAMGTAAMFGATLIMIIYLISDAFPAGFYSHPAFLWAFPFGLFMWLARVWLLCHRGGLQDDPVAFALKDPISLAYGTLMMIAFVAAVL
jgi:4-hydroxybenzoate polyprenyltransferase